MVEGWQVNPHHRDLVTAVLTGRAGRQQPHLSRAALPRSDHRALEIGDERIQLAWHGANHSPDNIYIHFPGHDTLMFIVRVWASAP